MTPIPRPRVALPVAAVTAAGALALAGCSEGGKDSSEPDSASTGSTASSADGASSPAVAENGVLTIPQDVDEETKKEYLLQNAIAACMRAKGFTYTPHVVATTDETTIPVDGESYDLAKKFRAKYGYGFTYARVVYPNDANVPGSEANTEQHATEHPDQAYLDALSPAQRQAYDKARGGMAQAVNGKKRMSPGCLTDAFSKVHGSGKSESEIERERAASEAKDLEARQALDGDPQLVSLAQDFASCLRGEGIVVTTTQPTAIGDRVKFQVNEQADDVDEVDEETARARLAQEINTALKDLECGKKFRAAYFPKLAENPFFGNG
ncbi:hypothetical protein [Streptomyces cadmiisoli]|uniref:hypothetical protein n=1 Tax=Streptomyces cadmiisoli TaxID=2184053 RepID=UPI003D73D8FE